MFIDKNSLKVKTSSMDSYLSLGQYITEARYGYNKLWARDSGRNLAGEQSGTLIGIFPKIIVSFRKLTQTELELLAPILDSASQSLQYYDANKKATVTMDTYTGDYEVTNKGMIGSGRKNESFNISFIAIRKRQ